MNRCNSNSPGSQLPLISISMIMISLLLYLCGDAASFLQYDRKLIASGQLWRCITGHWTHWSFDHFLWCAMSFIVLGSICERLNRRGFIISCSASALIIPAVNWFYDHDMLYYRGLSGVCSSVFVVGALLMARKAFDDKDLTQAILPMVGGTLFFIKILYEFLYGHPVFVQDNNMFSPVPTAHLAGAIVGLITGVCIPFQSQKNTCREILPQS